MTNLFWVILALPWLAAVMLLFFPKSDDGGQRQFTVLSVLVELLLLGWLFLSHQTVEVSLPWPRSWSLALEPAQLTILVFATILLLYALLLSPDKIERSHLYYAIMAGGLALVVLVVCVAGRQLMAAFIALYILLEFIMAGIWGGVENQEGLVRERLFFQGIAVSLLLLGSATDGRLSAVLLLLGSLFLLPLFPLPRWYKIWNKAPLGLVTLELLQFLLAFNFLVYQVKPLFISDSYATHCVAVGAFVLAILAAILALRQEDTFQLADMALRVLAALAVALLFIADQTPAYSSLLLLAAALLSFQILHWLSQWLKGQGHTLLIVRCQGLAGVLPRFTIFYMLVAASFTIVPLYTPLLAVVHGLLSGRWHVSYLLLAVLTLFFLSAAMVRGIIRVACGTSSVNRDGAIRDFSANGVVTGAVLLLSLVLLNVVGGLSLC